MTAGDSKAALTITPQPALAPSPQPRPAPTARALPPGLAAQVGQNWTPIVGQNWMPIDSCRRAWLESRPVRRHIIGRVNFTKRPADNIIGIRWCLSAPTRDRN